MDPAEKRQTFRAAQRQRIAASIACVAVDSDRVPPTVGQVAKRLIR